MQYWSTNRSAAEFCFQERCWPRHALGRLTSLMALICFLF